MDVRLDNHSLELLAEALRKTMGAVSGRDLDDALAALGWPEMLRETPRDAIPLVFGLLGETGAHAAVVNDVVLNAAGCAPGGTVPLPFAGGAWVIWERDDANTSALEGSTLDRELPIRRVDPGDTLLVASSRERSSAPLDAGRVALGWWLVGTSRAMLSLACRHALVRVQFGRSIASFQAVRHRLAETLVAIEGAEATLRADAGSLGSVLAKAAAGQAALTAARHCQQVLGGIGFTAEHELHRHVRRTLVLDGLLGSSRELIRQAGATVREQGSAPRLVSL